MLTHDKHLRENGMITQGLVENGLAQSALVPHVHHQVAIRALIDFGDHSAQPVDATVFPSFPEDDLIATMDLTSITTGLPVVQPLFA